jgi:lipopolysaccharide biosynthesis glycosyltransferase
MSKLHVACAARRDYVPHCAAMLHSLLGHRGGLDVQVHFLHGPDLPGDYPARLAAMVKRERGAISFLEVSEEPKSASPACERSTSCPPRTGTGCSCRSCCPT